MAKTWYYVHEYAANDYKIGYFQAEAESIEVFANASTFKVKTPNIRAAAIIVSPGYSWGSSRLIRPMVHASWDSTNTWRGLTVADGVGMGAYCAWSQYTHPTTFNTADYFDSTNPTVRSLSFGSWVGGTVDVLYNGSGTNINSSIDAYSGNLADRFTIAPITLTLNVPPTFNTTALSIDTASAYTNITTASVTISNTTAYYGGTITSVTFTIGSQTITSSGDGTLSILLDTAGTFTPTVTVTDSRGQTKTESLGTLTVNTYTAPTVSFTAERTTSTGTPDDEGTYATVDATFTFSDVIADLIAPSVVLTDENGTQTTPTVTWYSSRAADGTLSGSVTWANLSSGDTVYGLIPGLNTNYSYQILVRPRDDRGTGTAITQTVSSAFYTIDFLAGGHGIAFGQPARTTGFVCNMTATFNDDADFGDNVLIELPNYATSGVDKDIYDSIVALGWDSDVLIP